LGTLILVEAAPSARAADDNDATAAKIAATATRLRARRTGAWIAMRAHSAREIGQLREYLVELSVRRERIVERRDSPHAIWSAQAPMNPYRIVDESPSHITYEYRTAYTWALFAVLGVAVFGILSKNDALATAANWAMLAYFVAKVGLGFEATRRIRSATRSNAAEIAGNKLSFANPLRIRVPK
jgi:hypothetical protein